MYRRVQFDESTDSAIDWTAITQKLSFGIGLRVSV